MSQPTLKDQIRKDLWRVFQGYVSVYSETEMDAYLKREKDIIDSILAATLSIIPEKLPVGSHYNDGFDAAIDRFMELLK